MNSGLALGLAHQFELCVNDKSYDELIAVRGDLLYDAISELRRLDARERSAKTGGTLVAFVRGCELGWAPSRPEAPSGTLLYAVLPSPQAEKQPLSEADEALMRQALEALEWEISGYSKDGEPDNTSAAITALRARLETSNV